jgi:putative ABC transport system permease protein
VVTVWDIALAAIRQRKAGFAAVPGVDRAVGDVSVPVDLVPVGEPGVGHGWSSAALTPFSLRDGTPPDTADEVVLDAELARRAGVRVGGGIGLALASGRATYTVTGIAAPPGADRLGRQSVLFFSDSQARRLSGHPDQVAAIGVLARPGTDPDALAGRIRSALSGMELRTYTGGARGDAEFLEVGEARARLVVLSLILTGTAIMIVLLVVASTLALSIQQRRREFALLRAVAASPRQIRRMVGAEVLLVAGSATLIGTLAAIPPLVGISLGLTESPIPSMSAGVYGAIIGVTAALGLLAIGVPTRVALRTHPVDAIGIHE